MAAEVSTNTGYKDWNDQMYGHLTAEVQSLTRDGYKIMIIGDMKGHIGNAHDGIPDNHKGINSNGERILNFAELNELHIINRNRDLCTGTFTRIVPSSSTVLDYVLASDSLVPDILDMVIDEGKKLLYGSNHVAIRVDLKLRGSEVPLKD